MRFTGELRQRFDGENNEGEGTVEIDGATRRIELGANPHETSYRLDGEELGEGPLKDRLDAFFADIWPERDGDWNAKVADNVATEFADVDE